MSDLLENEEWMLDPASSTLGEIQSLMQGAVVPRPIALVSTVNKAGEVNLSPFSFFNLFSMRPPVLVFSPSRRGRNNTTKHTLDNVLEVPEAVVHIVSYSLVEQTSLSSVEFPHGVNEFIKSGFTEVPSVKVRPPRVLESPVAFECKVTSVVPLGDQGGAGNLVICEVLLAHVKKSVLAADGKIDPTKLDAVARMGSDYYSRSADGLFLVPKPTHQPALGFDLIPAAARRSRILTGNDLGRLGNLASLPTQEVLGELAKRPEVKQVLEEGELAVHLFAQRLIAAQQIPEAWALLMIAEKLENGNKNKL